MNGELTSSQEVGRRPMRRYERPVEVAAEVVTSREIQSIAFVDAEAHLQGSGLSEGSRRLLLGLLRIGTTRVFPGGGIGIEYGSLLKTAVRPDDLLSHCREVASRLADERVDLLLVPGMSGYPVGAMYSTISGIPAILLKKGRITAENDQREFPEGSFVIPSYTGDGDVVMSIDLDAVDDAIEGIVRSRLSQSPEDQRVELTIRCAGADDIIDKATMAQAITECAPAMCDAAVGRAISRHRTRTGDKREITTNVEVVSWVTPLIKRYNGPHAHLERCFGITPFAGVEISSVHLDPPAIGVEGVGIFAFAR